MKLFKGFRSTFLSVSLLLVGIAFGVPTSKGQNYMLRTGDYWAYWDYGFEEDPAWMNPDYDDFLWSVGPSPLGFGEPYIVTQLQPGIMTAYFRGYFYLGAAPGGSVRLRVRRDDGVIVYLNGLEIFRNNMPAGPVDHLTPAPTAVEANSFVEYIIDDPILFGVGYNVIAAEVHQQSVVSEDLVFDAELIDDNTRMVAITSPADNSTVAIGSDVPITADAGPAADVTEVKFYEGANLLATDQQAPYEAVLPSAQVSNYVLRAVAVFDDSTSLTSAPVRVAAAPARVLRGPYLNLGTPTSLFVRWRTDFASDSVVRYGLDSGNLNRTARVATVTIEHEVPLTGLTPDTKYYYSIGSSAGTQAGGADYYFVTAPTTPKPTRIWVIGDSGGASSVPPDYGSYLVRDAYRNYTGSRDTDVWLLLGDNAYGLGSDDEYQRGFFDVYPDMLRKTVVWSTIGNHEWYMDVYLNIFTFPKNGEAGGVASGVENYYSFDYGNIHFINLASYYSGSLLSNGPMCTWLKSDLEANTNKWTIAFFHAPPYTKGSHDSDSGEQAILQMRQNAVPILESYGVDLVLAGHSHVYERSYLLHGHYGYSWDLQPEMILDPGSGEVDDTGPYVKQTSGDNAGHGTVYVVAGSSGWIYGCCYGVHPAMYRSLAEIGSLVLDIHGDTLQGTFVRGDNVIDDYFTLVKEATIVRIVNLTVDEGTSTLSWTSKPDKNYQLEFTTNLAAGWAEVGGPIPATGTLTTTGHVPGAAPQGFYRVKQLD